MAEHEHEPKLWKQGDAVWGQMRDYGWVPGTIIDGDRKYPFAEFVVPRMCIGRYLRRRDPALNGADKPTAESEARR